jgi:large subunit ribosomal protein L10e
MARKPGVMYRSIKQEPYTQKEYMGGIPTSRITQFVLGNKSGNFPVQLFLFINEKCQIRHTALESARITSNRYSEKNLAVNEYRLKIRVYPRHVLRGNKQATGAVADRVSQDMQASFGKAVGIAARVKTNQVIMSVETFERHIKHVKEALRKASCKLTSSCKIKIAS